MMNISVLGAVQNFSYVICDKCGNKIELFGNEGENNLSIPILDRIPFDKKLSSAIDRGMIELTDNSYLANTVNELINK
ncbi:MAG: P-loop NTPase, partial [Clostridia bacterium]|nr:P-loop NTPase [Clostridia bacterium]